MKHSIIVLLLSSFVNMAMSQTKSADTLRVPNLAFNSEHLLIISPSKTSSKSDFNFFEGKWSLLNKILKVKSDGTKSWNEFDATQELRIILGGLGNVDNFLATRDGQPFEGMTLRLFNPKTRLWSIYWADSNYGTLYLPPVVGSFDNKVGHFFSQDESNGRKYITVYRWDARNAEKPAWSQATSDDDGKTWEWNWFMYFNRSR